MHKTRTSFVHSTNIFKVFCARYYSRCWTYSKRETLDLCSFLILHLQNPSLNPVQFTAKTFSNIFSFLHPHWPRHSPSHSVDFPITPTKINSSQEYSNSILCYSSFYPCHPISQLYTDVKTIIDNAVIHSLHSTA